MSEIYIPLRLSGEQIHQVVAALLANPQTHGDVLPFLWHVAQQIPAMPLTAIELLGTQGDQTPVEPLVAATQHSSEAVRKAALEALGNLGARAPLVPLMGALADPDRFVRAAAVAALGQLGERAPLELVHAALHDGDSHSSVVPEAAVAALGTLAQARRRDAYEELMRILAGTEASLRERLGLPPPTSAEAAPADDHQAGKEHVLRLASVKALAALGVPAAIEPLLVALSSSEEILARAAAEALAGLGRREGIPTLLGMLDRPTQYASDPQLAAIVALARLGEYATLERLLTTHPDPFYRRHVLDAWGAYSMPAPLAPVLAAMDDPDEHVRSNAAFALTWREDDLPVEFLLARLATEESPWVRHAIRQVLRDLPALPETVALEVLLAALRHEHAEVRAGAAAALGAAAARMPVEALLACLRDPDAEVRVAAAGALARLGPEAPVPALVAMFQRARQAGPTWDAEPGAPNWYIQRDALKALETAAQYGATIPADLMRDVLTGPDRELAKFALEVIVSMGANAPDDLLDLAGMALEDGEEAEEEDWQVTALLTMGWRAGKRAPLIPIAALASRRRRVREEAVSLLQRTYPEVARALVPEASALLLGQGFGPVLGAWVQRYVAEVLAGFDELPDDLVTCLLLLLDWPHWEARAAAARALGNVGRGRPDVLERLAALAATATSRVVRQAAAEALADLTRKAEGEHAE